MTIARLRALVRENGLRGYSRLKKAELITFLQENLQSRPPSNPPQQTSSSVKPRPRPLKPIRPPPPPPNYFQPYQLEQAFGRALWSLRINGRSRMDVETFFHMELTNFLSGQVIHEHLLNLNNMSLKLIKG